MIEWYANMLKFFAEKNVSSFCSAKATHIFSAKNIRILCIESAKTVNEMTLNELVKLTTLWTTGPRFYLGNIYTRSICYSKYSLCHKKYKWEASSGSTNETRSQTKKSQTFCSYTFIYMYTVCCGYWLEEHPQGASNEHPQHISSWRNNKKYQYFWVNFLRLFIFFSLLLTTNLEWTK